MFVFDPYIDRIDNFLLLHQGGDTTNIFTFEIADEMFYWGVIKPIDGEYFYKGDIFFFSTMVFVMHRFP